MPIKMKVVGVITEFFDEMGRDTNRTIYQCPQCKGVKIKDVIIRSEQGAPECDCVENTPRKDIRVGIAADSKFVDLDAVVGQIKEDLATIEIIRKEAKELAEQWIKSAPNGVRTLSVPYAAHLIIKAAKKGMTDDERLLWQEVLERC